MLEQIRMEIKEINTKKIIEKINEIKIFFLKINKINTVNQIPIHFLGQTHQEKKAQMKSDGRGFFTTDTAKIQTNE